MANKVKGPKLYLSQFGGEQPIPPEFVAAMERKEEVQAVPNDVVPEALSDLIVESKLETNRTGERVRKTVKKKSGNIVLGATRTNDQGQPVQVVLTLFPTGTAPTAPTATTNVSVKDLGNGWSIQEVGVEGSYDGGGVFIPGVFNNNLFGKETPNVTPQKFKTLIPVVTTRTDSAGTASAPTLTGDEFREVQEQITAYKKRVTVETQTNPTLPVALTEYETTNAKQLATVTETLETVGVPSAPTALTTVQVNNLGDGRQVRRLSTVDSLFPETRVSDEGEAAYLDSRIQHFFVTYDKKVTSTVAAGTSATPSALADPTTVVGLATGIGVVSSQAERIDATKVRVSNTVVTASGLSTLDGVEFDKINGNVLPITREVVAAGTAGTVLQVDGTYATVEPINSRFSIKTTRKTTTLSSSGRNYITWEDVTLPRVLTQFNAVVFTDKAIRDANQNTAPETVTIYSGEVITFPAFQNPYHQKPGGNIIHAGFDIVLRDFSGAYAVTVTESWKSTAFTGLSKTNYSPQSFSWSSPYSSGGVPECLHGAISISYSTGTTHPTIAFISGAYSFGATSPATLTGVQVIEDMQRPYEGGFMRTRKTIVI